MSHRGDLTRFEKLAPKLRNGIDKCRSCLERVMANYSYCDSCPVLHECNARDRQLEERARLA